MSMEFFTGFQWAVPKAFSDSVARAWFVEGDVLYDRVAAYDGDWRSAAQTIDHTIQVRSPARSSEINNASVRDVFVRNWGSEVRLEIYTHMKRAGPAQVKTTQGRLYTTLWKGQIDTLFEDKSPHPTLPKTAQQLSKNLQEAVAVALVLAQGRATFVMVRDLSNSVSRDKYQKILTKLRVHMSQDPIVLTPGEAKLSHADEIAPTVEIALFPTTGLEASQLKNLVKQAVYSAGKDGKKDLFQLSAHGIVV